MILDFVALSVSLTLKASRLQHEDHEASSRPRCRRRDRPDDMPLRPAPWAPVRVRASAGTTTTTVKRGRGRPRKVEGVCACCCCELVVVVLGVKYFERLAELQSLHPCMVMLLYLGRIHQTVLRV